MINCMIVKYKYMEVTVDAEFKDHICFLNGDSGSGNTFLLRVLESYLSRKNISYCLFNYSSMAAVNGFDFDSVDVVMLDNADLYMNRDIYMKAKKSHALVLICMHSYCGFDPDGSGEYVIVHEERTNTLRVRRLGI